MTSEESTRHGRRPPQTPGRRILQTAAPFAVSLVLLVYLFARIDLHSALGYLNIEVLLRFLGPLLLFNAATLAIEARCLHRVTVSNPVDAHPLGHATAARIKAACYLLGLLNYGLGAAGLSVLLQRRTGASLAAAAGMVFLISLLDITSVLVWVATGAILLQTDTFGVRLGMVAGMIGAILLGFVFLRLPISMGPFDVIRQLPIFRAPRTAGIPLLLEVGLLRLLFVGCFVALTAALFWSFEIDIAFTQLALGVGVMLIVSALPIAAGGLGTGQIVFVELFSGLAPDAQLLSASILLSIGMILMRALIGLVFASEFTREALAAARSESPLA